MNDEKKVTYPFGIYFCGNECKTLLIWYPDTVKFPDLNKCPDVIKCPICHNQTEKCEEFIIKDIWKELVPLFSYASTTVKYESKKRLIMIDNEHVHLIWDGITPRNFSSIN